MSPVRTLQEMVGSVPMTAERARYVELTRQGLNNSEVCRIIRIRRKLGSNWRNGWTQRDPATGKTRSYPPIVDVRVPRVSARFLSEEERVRIADLLRAGQSVRQIAAVLHRAPSTVSREVRRNSGATGKYRPFHAHKLARNRRVRERVTKIAANPQLREAIEDLLQRRWSPAQICQYLRATHPDDAGMHVVHETIYRDLFDWRGGALKREYCRMLRTKRSRRKPQCRSLKGLGRLSRWSW